MLFAFLTLKVIILFLEITIDSENPEGSTVLNATFSRRTRILTHNADIPPEVRIVGSPIGYRTQVNSLCQGNPSGKVRSVVYLAVAKILTSFFRRVIANDLSDAATEVMRNNVEINEFSDIPVDPNVPGSKPTPVRVVVNEVDAWYPFLQTFLASRLIGQCQRVEYNHRAEGSRVDVVDLDPYGTAAPFIDAAVQSVNDSALFCVTCTDLSVLSTTNYRDLPLPDPRTFETTDLVGEESDCDSNQEFEYTVHLCDV